MAVMAKARDDNVSRTFVFQTLSNKSSSRIIPCSFPLRTKPFAVPAPAGRRAQRGKAFLVGGALGLQGIFLLDGAGVIIPRPPHSTPSLFSKNFSGFRGIQDTLRAVPLFMAQACPSLKDNLLIY